MISVIFSRGSLFLMNNKYGVRLLSILLLSKILLVAHYFFCFYILGHSDIDFLQKLQFGDSHWYLSIANDGYLSAPRDFILHNPTNLPFFPLLPLCIYVLKYFQLSELSIIIFNQILSWASLWLLFSYLRKRYDGKTSFHACIFFIFSTEQIYFLSIYTESLFLFLLLCLLNLSERRQYFLASIAGGLLSATRFIGFLSFYLIIYQQYLDYRQKSKVITKTELLKMLINIMMCLSGLCYFMLFLHYHTNDFLAFYHAQAIWGRKTVVDIMHTLPFHPVHTIKDMIHGSALDGLMLILLIPMVIKLYINNRKLELLMLVIFVGPSLATFNTISLTRFIFILPATYLYFAEIIANKSLRTKTISFISLWMLSNYAWYLVFCCGGLI